MKTLHRAVKSVDRGGASLPVPFRSWTERQVTIRRGEVSMIAGPPGVGKSTLALTIAVKSQVPTLYVSADTHEQTMALRTISMVTGLDQVTAEQRIETDTQWASDVIRDSVSGIKWMMDASPTLADLEDEISVYRELQGSDPELVVVDNAVDITHEQGDEFGSLRSLMREVKWWARETGAAFLILHHTSEQYGGNPCPPRGALHGKISQIPSLVLTLGADQPGLMAVAPVKNRYGPADATGNTAIWMDYTPATMSVKDMDS
jgi:predicted ATP-dependent serine protease